MKTFLHYFGVWSCIVLYALDPAVAQHITYSGDHLKNYPGHIPQLLDKQFQPVNTLSQASYFELSTRNEKEHRHGLAFLFQKDSTLFVLNQFMDGVREGEFKRFFPDGTLEIQGNYKTDKRFGIWKYWYPNQQPREERFYNQRTLLAREVSPTPMAFPYKMMQAWSEEGIQMVKDGQGSYSGTTDQNTYLEENAHCSGNYVNGLRHGIWKSTWNNGAPYYEEEYAEGKLVRGKSFDLDGMQYTYTKLETVAYPSNGMEGFYKKLSKVMKYPKKARKRGVSGRVILGFIIERTGEVTDLQVLKSLNPECDAAALEALQKMPAWNPARERGRPVKQGMSLPVYFKLE